MPPIIPNASSAPPTLRKEADRLGIFIGAAVRPELFSEQTYAAVLKREFNMIEPENAMKWAALRPSRDSFDFAASDEVAAFAEANGQQLRGHTLAWHAFNPDWLTRGDFSSGELNALLREHLTTVMQRYAGQVFAWDVVNEAFDDGADGELRSSIWYDAPGIGFAGQGTKYIEEIFRWAREADPDALLFYNDGDAETLTPKSDAIYAMVKDFNSRGVPIDGVGLQMHVDVTTDLESLEENIRRFMELGIQVHITEMDVALPVPPDGAPIDPGYFELQALIYRQVLERCLRFNGCTAFQTWGVTDKYSWIPWLTAEAEGDALLLDHEYAPKPAYRAVLETLSQSCRTPSCIQCANDRHLSGLYST